MGNVLRTSSCFTRGLINTRASTPEYDRDFSGLLSLRAMNGPAGRCGGNPGSSGSSSLALTSELSSNVYNAEILD